ncbi:MAG TPA: lytic transglycosylase domain-containing protein [Blastocatellia bacterium]|nr:lytic transglycosylase domain-containing protein [Blastocatellia bacterium]
MSKALAIILITLASAVWASAQQPLLSPPERPPVPLTDTDQVQAELRAKPVSTAGTATNPQTLGLDPGWFDGPVSSGDATIDAMVRQAAARHGVDPRLIFLVIQAESGFRIRAVSPKGATGLMQLMPSTALRMGVTNILDPRENVFGGVKYLRWLLDRFGGDVRLALAGYNAGEGAVESYGNEVPPYLETQNYVRSIVLRYIRFRGLAGFQPDPVQSGAERGKERIRDHNQILQFSPTTEALGDPASRKK